MKETDLLTELRDRTAPENTKGVCPCLFTWLNRGLTPEELEEALGEPLREACERLLWIAGSLSCVSPCMQ